MLATIASIGFASRGIASSAARLAGARMMSTAPTLNYFSICGRGELCRLICAAGELEFVDKAWAPAFEDGGWRQGYQAIGEKHGFPGTMPILEHGDVNLFQHNAIESYLAGIAPKYKDLTAAQSATDLMFQLIKADLNGATESLLFEKIGPDDLVPIVDKTFGIVEGLLPESGFVNGLDLPTVADLAVLVMSQGCMPFQGASQVAGCAIWDGKKYPKITRVAKETMAYGPVAEFLAKSEHKTLKADPFGLMPPEYTA